MSCAIEQGLNRQSRIHCVSDGAKWIAGQADRVFASQGYFLVGYYHLCEYIADAAKECVGEDEKVRTLLIAPCQTGIAGYNHKSGNNLGYRCEPESLVSVFMGVLTCRFMKQTNV